MLYWMEKSKHSFTKKKEKKKAKQEHAETNQRGHTLTRSPQLFSLREDLCGSGSLLKVIVSAYVCVCERESSVH